MHPADLGPSSLPLSSPPLPLPALPPVDPPPSSRCFSLLASSALPPLLPAFFDLSLLLPPPVAAVAVAVAAAAAPVAAAGNPPCPRHSFSLSLSPPPPLRNHPPFAHSSFSPSFSSAFSSSSSSSSSSSASSAHSSLLSLFFFLSFRPVRLSCERIQRRPGECIQSYVPRASERLELLSKSGASSRIMGGCRCDRAENATYSPRFSCVYIPVGKTAPRTGRPLVRIIVRELLFREMQPSLVIFENARRVWEVMHFL